MFDNMENLKIISSVHKASKPRSKIENRASNGFIMRIKGSAKYDFGDRVITVKEGEMIFLPKGSCYDYETLCGTESLYTSINFQADLENPEVKVYSLDNFCQEDYMGKNFSDLWKFGTQSDKYKCLSMFYDLISYVSNIEHASRFEKRKYSIIDPAVTHLKEHIYDCTLRTEKLCQLCGISDTYFRKIFISRFGTNPQNYIVSKRLLHAKAIIDSGDFETIKEVAASVGYSDPLYFSKVFKKLYGVSPSDLNK